MPNTHSPRFPANLLDKAVGALNPFDPAGIAVDTVYGAGRPTDGSLPVVGPIIKANADEELLEKIQAKMPETYRKDVGGIMGDIREGTKRGLDEETIIENARKNSLVRQNGVAQIFGTVGWVDPYAKPADKPDQPDSENGDGRELRFPMPPPPDKRSDATDSVGGLANEAAETEKVMEQAGGNEQTANLDSRIQSMRDLAAQPIDQPAQSALLKSVDTWTESEMKDVLNSAQGDFTGANAGDPLKAHLYEKVQDWHTTNYGEGEQQYEGGKPVEPLPIRAIPGEPAPHLAKDGGDLWQASARMGDKLTGIAQTDGYEPSVKALQDGINMLNDASPPAERSPVWGDYTPQDRLKVDGDYGPKTDFALKSALADHGENKVDGALSLGRFKGFAEEAKGGDASGLGSMTTSLFGDDSGEALQRTLNRVGPDAVDSWQKLEEDNQIGPMTTNAFASVMDSFDPGEFTRGFGEEMGLL